MLQHVFHTMFSVQDFPVLELFLLKAEVTLNRNTGTTTMNVNTGKYSTSNSE